MNNDQAKFLLRAYRPHTADAQDPLFSEPLAAAQNDPELSAWLESEEAFDDLMSRKLQDIEPPAGLEDAILAGVRATQQKRQSKWRAAPWIALALAASVAVVVTWRVRGSATGQPGAEQLAAMAMNDLAASHSQHEMHPPSLSGLLARLEDPTVPLPLPAHVKVDLEQLARDHCRSVNFGGANVYEVCFKRNGVWFHLYAGRADQFKEALPAADAAGTGVFSRGKLSAAVWRDGGVAYALVTRSDLLPPVLATLFIRL
jgi:hypothetical protein